jgi:hypothetical protein
MDPSCVQKHSVEIHELKLPMVVILTFRAGNDQTRDASFDQGC